MTIARSETMKTQAAKRRIAIHEAGHAVIGRVLGIECGGATIEQDTDSAGHGIIYDPHRIWYAWEQVGRYRDFSTVMRGRVMTFMAGREAEKECLGRAYGGDGDDRRQIAFMLDDLYRPESAARWEKRLRRHTRGLVRRHRNRIEQVAAVLLANGTVTKDQLDIEVRHFPQT